MKTRALLLLSIVSVVLTSGLLRAQTTGESISLFPVVQNGKYGYIDRTGKYVWNPTD